VAAKGRVAASLKKKKKKLALQINSRIILLVLREHPGRLLLLILLHNLVNGRALRACQQKKTRNRALPVVNQKLSSKVRQTVQKASKEVNLFLLPLILRED
jgi:hypothetical protein